MTTQNITNPLAAHTTVSDHRTARDDAGGEVPYGKTTRQYRANATTAPGQVVDFVVPTASVPLSVTPSAATTRLTAGVAETGGPAGSLITVVVEGLAFPIADDAITAGAAVTGAAGGEVESVAPDATTVVGSVLGTAIGTGVAGEPVPVLVHRV